MDKAGILHIVALALQPHITEGRSAGIGKNNMAIKITDLEGNKFIINVIEQVEDK